MFTDESDAGNAAFEAFASVAGAFKDRYIKLINYLELNSHILNQMMDQVYSID